MFGTIAGVVEAIAGDAVPPIDVTGNHLVALPRVIPRKD